MAPEWVPSGFIDEEISVSFRRAPTLAKKPDPPDDFVWRGETFRVHQVVSTWFDYGRRGRSERNMTPEHAAAAERRGSWGVGRFYFRVVTVGGRAFDLYYDRAPEAAGDRAGHWYLWREVRRQPPSH